ncbi:hypothetical protein AWB93_13600 [Mycobacterium bohemicum]|uniref:ATPase n=1 Tax=Mycobacterium bohemicum TaxID=56425 RepID=A0A1X1R2P4_MYCBE|nr:hypothetical protein AWB93_13600 [Mycobacterium bohemicum]
MRATGAEWRHDGRADLRPADGGGVRLTRADPKAGRAAVSYENTVGLVLSILLAVFLACALLFPERF